MATEKLKTAALFALLALINTTAPERISERKCLEYGKLIQKPCKVQSNLSDGPLTAAPGEFPHMAAVGWPRSEGTEYVWRCLGSLISDRFVLSAAHCTSQKRFVDVVSDTPTVVRLGDHDLRDDIVDGANPITVNIEEIIRNPQYKPPYKYHDIVLLKLERAVELNNFVRPACLYSKDPLDARKVIASGWGQKVLKGSASDVLRKVQLKVYENDYCQSNFGTSRTWRHGFSNDQMCAGDDDGAKDIWLGDSGGPLQVESPDNPCLFYIAGVTSFGSFIDKKFIGVHTIVSHYLDWIEDEVWNKSQ